MIKNNFFLNLISQNHPAVVKLLVQKDAKVDILNNDGKAPYDLTLDIECKALLEYSSKYSNYLLMVKFFS